MGPKPDPSKKESNPFSTDKCFLGWYVSEQRFIARKKEDAVFFEAPQPRFLWVYLLNFVLACFFFLMGFCWDQDPRQWLMWACRGISASVLITGLVLPIFGAIYSLFFQKPKVILNIERRQLSFFHGVRKVTDIDCNKICSIEIRNLDVKMWKPPDTTILINGVFFALDGGQGFFLVGALKKEEADRILEELRPFFPKAKVA